MDSLVPRRVGLAAFLAALLCALGFAVSAHAATTYTVNTTADHSDGTCDATDCSLRDAVEAANSDGDDSIVNLPAGHYTLDPATSGLHIFGDGTFTLVGAGARSTIVDGGGGAVAPHNFDTTDDTVFTIEAFCKCAAPANATISGITVTGGNPDQNGGGFLVDNAGPSFPATLHLFDSTVTGNQAGSSDGGGIFNRGVIDVQRVTFSGNFSDADGSAIATENFSEAADPARGRLSSFATATIVNSTFSGNGADSNTGGLGQGAIFNDGGTVNVINSTIDGNAVLDGSGESYGPAGGIATASGQTSVVNTIVSNNTASPEQEVITAPTLGAESPSTRGSGPTVPANCSADAQNGATLTSNGHNIETATDCGFTASGDQQNTNPVLGALGNNGGQMDTMALLAGSPAIDHADAANCPATDEIGTTRPQGPACDVGAYEVPVSKPPAPPVTPPAKPAAPKVGVAGVRRACVSSSFHIRFHVATSASVKSVVVKLDGKRIKSTSRASFTLTVNSKKLSSGRHRLTITATDSAGQTTTTHKSFSVCAAAKPKRKAVPRFTG